jgi:hypothetical protein
MGQLEFRGRDGRTRLAPLLRSTFIGAAGVVLAGCPYVCKHPVSYEVAEPSLGTRTASLTWLQTGRDTELQLTSSAAAPVTVESCSPEVEVTYTLRSTDGAIDQSIVRSESVNADGTFSFTTLELVIESERAIEAGVAPEFPDWLERRPTFLLVLPRAGDTFADAEIRAISGQDDVTLALVSFGAEP